MASRIIQVTYHVSATRVTDSISKNLIIMKEFQQPKYLQKVHTSMKTFEGIIRYGGRVYKVECSRELLIAVALVVICCLIQI